MPRGAGDGGLFKGVMRTGRHERDAAAGAPPAARGVRVRTGGRRGGNRHIPQERIDKFRSIAVAGENGEVHILGEAGPAQRWTAMPPMNKAPVLAPAEGFDLGGGGEYAGKFAHGFFR